MTHASSHRERKGYNFSEKGKGMFYFYWNILKSDCQTSVGGFEWFLSFLSFCLTLSVLKKLKNKIFKFWAIPQTLKSITREPQVQNLLTWVSLESLLKTKKSLSRGTFTFTVFEILLFEVRSAAGRREWKC